MGLIARITSASDFLHSVFREFQEDNGAIIAAAMAFYLFVSLIPVLMLGVAVVGFMLGSRENAERIVFNFLNTYAPVLVQKAGGEIESVIKDIVRGRETIGGIGLLVLIWTGSQVFVNLQKGVNLAWDTPEDRGFLRTRLLAFGLMVAVGLILLGSLGITALVNLVQNRARILGFSIGSAHFVWTSLVYIIPFLATVAIFILMYKVIPTRPVSVGAAAISGVTAGVLWESAKHMFGWYIASFSTYSAVYGSLAGLMILAVWIYYSSAILILSAEVGAEYGRRIRGWNH